MTDKFKKDSIYKLDIFRVLPKDHIPMLLYSTGSKEHNIILRQIAKKKGMLLNQKGLFKKTASGMTQIDGLNSERAYFTALGLKYKEPKER
jgi:DNA polymerase (family 10)